MACAGRRGCRLSSSSAGGSPANGRLAQLGRHPRQAERARRPPARSARPAAARAPRRTRASRSRARARCRSAPAARRRARSARPRPSADRAALATLHHRDDLRQRGEAVEHRRRIGRRAHDREVLARVAPAARVAGRLAVRARPRSPRTSSRARSSSSPARRPRAPRASASSTRASVLGPTPGHRPQPPRERPPRGTPPASARPAPARSPPTASCVSPRKRPSPISSGTSSRSSSRSSAISPVSTSSRSRASIAAPDPAQLAHLPGADELGDVGPRRASSRPHGGRRGPSTGSPRPARAASRTRRAGRRCAGCPRAECRVIQITFGA